MRASTPGKRTQSKTIHTHLLSLTQLIGLTFQQPRTLFSNRSRYLKSYCTFTLFAHSALGTSTHNTTQLAQRSNHPGHAWAGRSDASSRRSAKSPQGGQIAFLRSDTNTPKLVILHSFIQVYCKVRVKWKGRGRQISEMSS